MLRNLNMYEMYFLRAKSVETKTGGQEDNLLLLLKNNRSRKKNRSRELVLEEVRLGKKSEAW